MSSPKKTWKCKTWKSCPAPWRRVSWRDRWHRPDGCYSWKTALAPREWQRSCASPCLLPSATCGSSPGPLLCSCSPAFCFLLLPFVPRCWGHRGWLHSLGGREARTGSELLAFPIIFPSPCKVASVGTYLLRALL